MATGCGRTAVEIITANPLTGVVFCANIKQMFYNVCFSLEGTMPPLPKFSESQIVDAALDIVRTEGIEMLTARSLARQLNSSSRPIFTTFSSMDDVVSAVHVAAKKLYASYVAKGLAATPAFKGVGTQYITFAIVEPKLFQLLFMAQQPNTPTLAGVLPQIDDGYDQILQSIVTGYNVSIDAAVWLYRHLWIYSHGIATLCATKMCRFTPEQIGTLLTEVCTSLLIKEKTK
jgi:hypothetical protein